MAKNRQRLARCHRRTAHRHNGARLAYGRNHSVKREFPTAAESEGFTRTGRESGKAAKGFEQAAAVATGIPGWGVGVGSRD